MALSPNVDVTKSRDLAPWVGDLLTALKAVRQIELILRAAFQGGLPYALRKRSIEDGAVKIAAGRGHAAKVLW